MQEIELATRLLDVTNETELAEFVDSLVAAHRLAGAASSRAGVLADLLRQTAVATVPTTAGLLAGGHAARRAATRATRAYDLQSEGLSAEDRDFELARRFVCLARSAVERLPRAENAHAALAGAAHAEAPGLLPLPPTLPPTRTSAGRPRDQKESPMFETGMQSGEYQDRGPSRHTGWNQQGEGEGPYAESEFGPGEYGETEFGPGEYREYGESGYGPGEYAYEDGGRSGEYQEGPSYEMEGEEERFLPALAGLIPVVSQVLGGLLGGGGRRRREVQGGYAGESEAGEWQGENGELEAGQAGEAEESFLNEVFSEVLGQEAEADEAVLSPAQEMEFAERLLEASDEQEFSRILGSIVNTVGRAVQGIRGAASSPQGRALIDAVKPLARSALPSLGGAIGSAIVPGVGGTVGRALGSVASSLFESETAGMSAEQDEFEAARNLVRLTASAARQVAAAPPGAPPELVGELVVFRASRYIARPLYRRALRAVSPFARRYYGRRYYGFRGRRYGRPYAHAWRYRGPRYWSGFRGPRYGRYLPGGYAYRSVAPPPEPQPEPGPEPGPPPPRPGYRWVAVPIGAPAPTSMPDEPTPTPPEPSGPEQPPAQSEYGEGSGGRWVRRNGAIVLHGA